LIILHRTFPRLAVLAAALALALAAPAQADVAIATGVAEVEGERVLVEVFVAVPGTRSAAPLVEEALEQQDAEPVEESAFNFSGLRWASLPVRQYYNPDGEALDALGALRAAQGTWSAVQGSAFGMADAGLSDRCPSLTRGCGGQQTYDDFNDVGWQRLSRGTLGVTWYSPLRQEADVALTTRYPWTTGCDGANQGAYDVETVLLHENGHVAGLDHSEDERAVMYASYQGPHCALGDDDAAAIGALYPRSEEADGESGFGSQRSTTATPSAATR